MSKENYIIPLALELEKHIEKKIYFLKLPGVLKEKLIRLEELSRNGQGGRGKFLREKHNVPLNPLKQLFVSYLPGVTDMKAVSDTSDDLRWLISAEPIHTDLVVKIIKVWIDAFYIEETESDKKWGPDVNAKKYAEQVRNELDTEIFHGCSYEENVVLFHGEEIVDKDAYLLLPLIAVNQLVGTEVTVNREQARWMYSKKNEIVTDPIRFKDAKGEDFFSFVATFSVQTIPPYHKPYLNVKISSRRWISKNKSEKVPFYTEEKSVYVRINDKKLQAIHAKYERDLKVFEWVCSDKKSFCALYGTDDIVQFNDIICNPSRYMKGMEQKDYYIPFEYGMKDGNKKMHNQDAGISTMDRREIFEDIESKLHSYSGGSKKALCKAGTNSIVQTFFQDNLTLKTKDSLDEKFRECVNAVCGTETMTIEVCYSAGQEELRNAFVEKLNVHFANTNVKIVPVFIDGLAECLVCGNEKKPNNLEGHNARIQEVKDRLGIAKGTVISIVIIHEPDYYRLSGKTDFRADPKNALRAGFANTGRLTQFIVFESYVSNEKKRLKTIESGKEVKKNGEIKKTYRVNASIKSTLLDTYRQLGIHNCLVKSGKKTTLGNKTAVGIYVVNYKKLFNDIIMTPFPIVVSCDLTTHKIMVQTELSVFSKITNKKESAERISCEYKEFPIKFHEMIARIGTGKKIIPSERFLYDWFEDLRHDKKYEIMIVADGTSRKIVEGITNKEIREAYGEERGYISKISIDGKCGFEILLKDYDNIDLLRIRVNDEVPDYIPSPDDEEKVFKESRGIYQLGSVYYSKEVRRSYEAGNTKQTSTKLKKNGAFSHRNLIEIYPMYISDREKELDCVRDVHNLRNASIQYETGATTLPMPLHLAKLLEEYFI